MKAKLQSALFPGHVTHARLTPKVHKLAYRIYSLLIDLDELDELDRRLRWFSVDRFNLFHFTAGIAATARARTCARRSNTPCERPASSQTVVRSGS